jgi:hypothetical protein
VFPYSFGHVTLVHNKKIRLTIKITNIYGTSKQTLRGVTLFEKLVVVYVDVKSHVFYVTSKLTTKITWSQDPTVRLLGQVDSIKTSRIQSQIGPRGTGG